MLEQGLRLPLPHMTSSGPLQPALPQLTAADIAPVPPQLQHQFKLPPINQSWKRPSGGIAVYVRNDFECKDTLVFTCHDDIICIKLSANKLGLNHDLYLCLCYVKWPL